MAKRVSKKVERIDDEPAEAARGKAPKEADEADLPIYDDPEDDAHSMLEQLEEMGISVPAELAAVDDYLVDADEDEDLEDLEDEAELEDGRLEGVILTDDPVRMYWK